MPSVRAALRACGRRNALTPLAIASTPVSAVEPEANARRRTKSPIAPARRHRLLADGGAALPVGAAGRAGEDQREHRGDERVGRDRERESRLADAAQVRHGDQRHEREREGETMVGSAGTAETSARTPAATDTATVRT